MAPSEREPDDEARRCTVRFLCCRPREDISSRNVGIEVLIEPLGLPAQGEMLVDQVFKSQRRRDAIAIHRRLFFDDVFETPEAGHDAKLRFDVDVGSPSVVIEPCGFSYRSLAEEADSKLTNRM